jgi:hypothetical protein
VEPLHCWQCFIALKASPSGYCLQLPLIILARLSVQLARRLTGISHEFDLNLPVRKYHWFMHGTGSLVLIGPRAPPEGRNAPKGLLLLVMAWFCEQQIKNPKPWMRQNGLVNLRMWILLKTRYFYSKSVTRYILYKNVKMNRKWNLIGFKIFRKSSQVQYGRYFSVNRL